MKSLILYFQFFTRIPIPIAVETPESYMRKGVRYFTLFGLLVGGMEGIIFFLCQLVMPLTIAWVVTLFADILITGGFHLDALADMADGLFSSRDRQRMLEIMKDSRVGSNGVLALIFYYLILVVGFSSVSTQLNLWNQILFVVGFHVIGKNGISLLFYHMNYAGASPNGLGQLFVGVKTLDVLIAQMIGLLLLAAAFREIGVILFLGVAIVIWLYRHLVIKKVGGFNGDTLGAASPISQMIYLILWCCIKGR